MLQKLCTIIAMTIMTSISPLSAETVNLNSETAEEPIGVTYEVPEGVTDMPKKIIPNRQNIETIILPSTAVWDNRNLLDMENDTMSWDYAFPKLKKIIVSKQNTTLSSYDGVLFDKNRETLLFYPASKEGKIYTVPEGVTKIKDFAFQQNKNLEEIILPDSLKTIETGAFRHTELKHLSISNNVILSDDPLERSIDLSNSTISVTISGGVKRIGDFTFYRHQQLKKIGLSEGLEEIGEFAFYRTGMNVIAIPKSVKKMETSAFERNDSLKFVIYRGIKQKLYNVIQEAEFDERPGNEMPEIVKEVNLVIDDVPIDFDGLAERPFYYKNKVYVPSQYVCNLCGISTKWISWYPCTAQYQKEDTIVKVTTGENIATINNEPFDIGAEAFLINEESPYTEETELPITMEDLEGNQSTIYCPIDTILEKFGMNSHYSKLKNTLYIETK